MCDSDNGLHRMCAPIAYCQCCGKQAKRYCNLPLFVLISLRTTKFISFLFSHAAVAVCFVQYGIDDGSLCVHFSKLRGHNFHGFLPADLSMADSEMRDVNYMCEHVMFYLCFTAFCSDPMHHITNNGDNISPSVNSRSKCNPSHIIHFRLDMFDVRMCRNDAFAFPALQHTPFDFNLSIFSSHRRIGPCAQFALFELLGFL